MISNPLKIGDTIPISELIYPGIFPGEIHEIRKLVLCPQFKTHMATAASSENLLKRFREVQGKFKKPPKRAGN